MTKERYLQICEATGQEPDPEKMPPEWDDLPEIVQQAIIVYNALGDRIAADIGYLGKDYTLLPVYIQDIENKDLFLEILAWLDGKLIKKSQEDMKRARDKMKSKK